MAGGQCRADRDDRNAGDEHQNVDPDRVDGVAQAAHKAGIGGEELHNRLSYGIRWQRMQVESSAILLDTAGVCTFSSNV